MTEKSGDHDLLIELAADAKYLVKSFDDLKKTQAECKTVCDTRISSVEKKSGKAYGTANIALILALALLTLVIEHALAK